METQKSCPECRGPMVLTPGGGGLFWRCPRCGRKVPHSNDDLDDREERGEK